MADTGRLFVLIGPGGSGKTAIITAVRSLRPEIRFVPTTTTRPPRPGEMHGREYLFVSEEAFQQLMRSGALLEWETIHGHLYGTQQGPLAALLSQGHTGITSLDYKGGVAVSRAFPDNAVTIFVQPGSLEELRVRLACRPGTTQQDASARLLRAQEEQLHAHDFHYLVTNRNGHIDDAIAAVLAIIDRHIGVTGGSSNA